MDSYLIIADTATYLNTSERFVRRLIAERRPMTSSHHCRPSPRTTTSREREKVGSVNCMGGC
jgi:hypothetical protein